MTACMPNSAIAVKPSVWNQLVSAGTLRKRNHLNPVLTPLRAST